MSILILATIITRYITLEQACSLEIDEGIPHEVEEYCVINLKDELNEGLLHDKRFQFFTKINPFSHIKKRIRIYKKKDKIICKLELINDEKIRTPEVIVFEFHDRKWRPVSSSLDIY